MTKSTKKPNEKILYIGDNLPIMLGMESGMVDLIYTDPPFNTGTFRKGKTEKHSFIDTWSDKQVDYAHAIALKFQYPNIWNLIVMAKEMHSPAMQHYLEFMAPRMVQMHRLLKDTGSLYLHCDPTASHYLKLILDSIFGSKNFRNEIVWAYKSGGASKKHFSRKHDLIYAYAKNNRHAFFLAQKEKSYNRGLKPYGFKDVKEYQDAIGWHTLVNMKDVWHIDMVGRTSKERTGYATQKPIALLDRIITASSNKDDLVLDPFCGCATACVSAAGLNRGWIGIDQNDEAPQILNDRMDEYFTTEYQTNMPAESKAKTQKAINLPKRQVTGYTRVTKAKGKLHLLQRDYKNPGYPYCRGCTEHMKEKHLTVDHILAVDKGGLDELENYQLLCTTCNSRKGNKDMKFLYERIDAETRQKRLEIEERRGNYA